jgi:TonB family protein
MGYQALLFCPDEKTARSVTQVLSELDFTVIPCSEPFGAVKKLMGEHFDAVVVDCDNEQNATLLFKSARNTPNNQSSLAVAVVEGQAGVAKAFRIGANLVLTKPINVEQAKGTLRVARGLLRKNEAGKPAATAAGATVKPVKPAAAPAKPATAAPNTRVAAARPAPPVAPSGNAATPTAPRVVASVPADTDSDAEILDVGDEITSPSMAAPESKITASQRDMLSANILLSPASTAGFGSSAGSAPAPARETKPSVEAGHESGTPEPESSAGKVADPGGNTSSIDGMSAPAPAFTFGGNVSSGAKPVRGNKMALVAVAAVVLIAAGGYALWMQWVRSSGAATPFTQVATPVTKPAAVPQVAPSAAPANASHVTSPTTPPATSPATSPAASSISDSTAAAKASAGAKTPSDSDGSDADSVEDEPVHPSKTVTKGDSAKAPDAASASSKAPATKSTAPTPIVIKNGHSQAAKPAMTADAAAPDITAIAPPDNGGSLPNLMGGDTQAPAPVLQTLTVSQGVSRGLLVRQTQPVYPATALQMHVEGAVELLATISKTGNISAVKIVRGDPRLARAAADAVKQWKYKPYLLNGEPVEIQTQITMNFKLPN